MKNKQIKLAIYNGFKLASNSESKQKSEWATDRVELMNLRLPWEHLRHPHLSTISLTASELKGE